MGEDRGERKILNKSYSYLVPLLNEYCRIDGDYFLLLDNVYTGLENNYENIIAICYLNVDNDPFQQYIADLQLNKLFKFCIDNEDYITLVFSFPEEFMFEYNCYKTGKFSQFRERAKNIILNYILGIHKLRQSNKLRTVLYKDPKLKEELEFKLGMKLDENTELSSIPDIKLDTFYY